MVMDAQGEVLIIALTAPKAFIDAIRFLDSATSVWYSLFPEGQQVYCTKGSGAWLNMRVRNAGDATGTLYLKVTRLDTGAVIFDSSWVDPAGGYHDIDSIGFTMPNDNLTLRFEIGHI